MKYALLGDIHSNLEALEAVLADAERSGAGRVLCLGDIVGYNADPSACVERIVEAAATTVRGNHDHEAARAAEPEDFAPLAAEGLRYSRNALDEAQKEWLRKLPLHKTIRSTGPLGDFSLVHSTFARPDSWAYVFTALDAQVSLSWQKTRIGFFGHTHVPHFFVAEEKGKVETYCYHRVDLRHDAREPEASASFEIGALSAITEGSVAEAEPASAGGRRYFVNIGSVGQPRDGDPRASYALFDTRTGVLELRRIPYDLALTQRKIILAGLPEELASRLERGR
ncbi:Predicted phosphodiesterase [Verrucomicrobium sp. GAS474]|uniref:metallophosphoesterase family protein n=1 Tax=Verrucomicrobium sp. GAS474 TaxID=1882831 RepID=UPI00087B6D51|nr:metallophosphoesterase family protein [Verrucomicrobium sp. GAS474]SDT92372.1 Predicted phosphodiesterase [Verrucomicrobium sp. GAS474]